MQHSYLVNIKQKICDNVPISVFPVPGGPNKSIPFGGERRPVKISGLSKGNTTISFTVFLTNSNPAISLQSVGFPLNKISEDKTRN